MLSKVVCAIFIQTCLWVLLVSNLTCATESDIECLKTLKSQLKDPNRHLYNWDFNTDEGYYCKFSGVSCWSDYRVTSIELDGLGLEGEFPSGVKGCPSLQVLDLSGNKLSGTLPSDLFSFLPYLTTLNLSNNSFSGEIPASWSYHAYLNILFLDYNHLTGQIPTGVTLSPRLKQFSVSHNDLEGPIPESINGSFFISSFEDNLDLCGFPLDPCPPEPVSLFDVGAMAAIISAAAFFPIGVAIGWFCFSDDREHKQRPRRR